MSEDFVMPPNPFVDGLDYSGPDNSGPLNLSDLNNQQTKLATPAAPVLPYDERLEQYKTQGGTSSTNPFLRGAKSGFLTGFASDLGFLETVSDIAGDVGKETFKSGGDFLTELSSEVPRRQLNEIEDFGDAMDYAAQSFGMVFGQIGSIIPTAIATGGTGAVARVLGKETLKGVGKRAAAKRGVAAVAAFTGRPAIMRGIGGNYRGVREDTGVESPFLAVPFGVASGMAERFGLGKTFESFFEALPRESKKILWNKVLTSGLKAAGKAAIIEGGTEAIQESLQLTASKLADNTFDLVNGDNLWRVADAAVTGALGSVPFGAAGGAGNYISSTPSKKVDNNLTTTVNSRVDKTIPDKRLTKQVSMTLFRGMQEKLSRLEANLTDPEFIPTDQDIQELESAANVIPNYGVMSDSQKQGLLNVANSTLEQYRERAQSVRIEEEAAQAEQQSAIEIAARKNREAAEQGLPQGVLPEGVTREKILPESDAPYNKPENKFTVGQSYDHLLDDGVTVVARVTKVGRDGRVLESVLDSDDSVPLISTFNNKTFDLHGQSEIERAARIKENEKFGVVDSTTRISENNNFIAQKQEENVRAKKIKEQNEKISEGDPLTIKQTPTRRVRRVNVPEGKKVQTRTTTTYKRPAPKTRSSVSSFQANRTNAKNKASVLSKSKYVRVSKQGAKRVEGTLENVRVINPDAENQQFEADVLLKNGKRESIIITSEGKGQFTTQASLGAVELIASKGKLSKNQEAEVTAKEQSVTPEPSAQPKPRATAETKPFDPRPAKQSTQQQATKKVSLIKRQPTATEQQEVKEPETRTEADRTTKVLNLEITEDNPLYKKLLEIEQQEVEESNEVLSFEQYVARSLTFLGRQVVRGVAYIHQLYLNKKIPADFDKSSRGYKARRKEFVDRYLKSLEASGKREVYMHLPSLAEDGKQFLEGLFDAIVVKYKDVDKEKFNQSVSNALKNSIVKPEYIKNFIDTPIKEDGDSERTVILANNKVFSGELGYQLNNLKLFNDNLQGFDNVIDFAMSGGKPVISIKVLGPSTDSVAYTLRKDLLNEIRLQKSIIRKGTSVFAHIPESLFFDSEGNFQFDNWTLNKKKAPARFIKDISWIGLESDDLRGLITERSKGTALESLLNSERGAIILGSSAEIAGIIGSGIRLAKDGKRYTPVSDQGKIAKEKLVKKVDAKLANLSSDQLVENLKYAVDIHLDHFNALTSNQINESDRSALELKRLKIYREKLNKAIEGQTPKTINLYKLDSNFKNTNKFYVQAVDRTGRVIERRRQSLSPEVKIEAKKDLVRIDNRIKKLESSKISNETKMVNLVASKLSGIPEARYEWPLDYVLKKLISIDNYFQGEGDINDAFEAIYAYTSLAEQEKARFLDEYRASLPSETVEEYDAVSDLEGKISQTSIEEDTGITTEEEQAGDAVVARERIEEYNKFIEGRFEGSKTLGIASRRFKKARKDLLDLINSNDENDSKFNEKLIVAQSKMLEQMNIFLESQGTDFIEGNIGLSVELFNLFLDVKRQNLSKIEKSSLYESKQTKINRQVRLLDDALKDLENKRSIFINAQDVINPIRKEFKDRMQAEIDQVYAIPEERDSLSEQGFINKNDGTKKVLQDSDVTAEKLLNNPRFNIRLTPQERLILEDNAPHIEAYNKAEIKFNGLRTGLALLDLDSAAVYGQELTDNKSGQTLDDKKYFNLKSQQRELRKQKEQIKSGKTRLLPHERKELEELNKSLVYINNNIKQYKDLTEVNDKFVSPTNKSLSKRSSFYRHVFDSFISGGVRNTNAGAMFGYMVGLANKFNEDQFRETGLYTKIQMQEGGRVETPATLYYKLYKTFEIRDPFKLLSHPAFKESKLYVGPIRPDWHKKKNADQEWLEARKENRIKIVEQINEYKKENTLDDDQANKAYIRNIVLKGIVDNYITLFTAEAGYDTKRKAIIKNAAGFTSRMNETLDSLAEGLDMPFVPTDPESKELSENRVSADELQKALESATEKRSEANELFAKYKGEFDVLKRRSRFKIFDKGETSDMLEAELAPVEEAYNSARKLQQEAAQEVRLLQQKINDLDVEEGLLLGQAIQASSLDLIQGKELSTTISQTLPYGYNKIKGNRRSMDKAIQSNNHWEAPVDGQLLSEQSRVDSAPVTLGSARGPNEIAQVLEENRDSLGSDAVDRALDMLATIPEKYLNELSLVVQSAVSSNGGVKLGGSFVEALKTVFIPVEGNTTESFTHEFMHYMHAFLPKDFQERVSAMRKNALNKIANNTEDGKLRYRIEIASELINLIEGGGYMSVDGFQKVLDKYGDKASDMYHLINDNEFFVYLMTNEGSNDIQNLSPEQNPIGFIARAKRFLSELFEQLLNKVTGSRNATVSFRDEVMAKFKSGEFSLERRKFTAGPELDASLLTSKQVRKAAELNVRNAILTPEGGANVEAGRRLSLEAGAYHNFIYDLSQKILIEMGESGEFANILGSPDEQVKLSKRAQTFAKIKESEAVRMFLEENEQTTGGVIFSPEGYLGLLEQRKRNPKAIPESVWQQISNEFFKNTEYFLRSHRERLAKLEKLKGEKQEEKILAKLNEASQEYDTSQIARNAASSLSSTIESLLEHAKIKALEGETIKRLESYGFNSSLLKDQLDRYRLAVPKNRPNFIKTDNKREAPSKRGDLIKLGNDFYETVWFNAEAQIILHKGKTSSGKKATWEDLVRTYMRSKGIKRITDVQPITKMLADHILRIHQNEIDMKDIDQKMLEDSFGVYNEYEKEIYTLMTKDKNGSKKAFDKIMKDFKSAAGEESVANKLYLSIRRDVRKEIKLMNDATIASELMGRIIESDEFKNARQAAAQEIDAKPNRDITIGEQEIFFPHPNKEEDFRMTYDVSDKLGREKQLEGLALYVQSMNDWLLENQPDPENNKAGDPYFEFWKETRDIASATMLSPTMRSGQSMKAALEFNLLRPLQNLLSGIGTFTSKLALTHMDNLSMTMERTSQWKAKHEQKVVNALQAAAKSHGFTADPIGIEDWFHNVGERYFATANFEGRALKVGDKVTTSDKTDVKTITKEDEEALKTQVAAFDELFNMDVKKGRGALIRKRKTTDEVKGVRIMDAEGRKVPLTIGRKALKVTELTLPKTFSSKSVRMSRSISDLVREKKTEITDIDSTEILTEKEKRQQKLILFKSPNRRGDSIYSLIAEEFDRFVFAFLDNREGKITDGTNPYFTEGIYDEARDAMLNGDITNMEQLANFFADRSVDPEKIGETDEQFQLSDEEALFELLREMAVQADRFRDFIDPKLEDDESSVQYKFVKLKTDSAFTTARQEPIANYYYYKYGVDETVGMSNMEVESSAQYIDSLISALKGVEGELDNAANEKKIASERGNLEEFMEGKKQSAANKESFLDYERVEAQKASVSQIINDLNAVRERDVRYELQVNRTWRRMFGDLIGVAIQMPTTALANLIGTPVRSAMRMQALFGFAPALNARFAVDAIKELAKGAATFGVFGMRGAYAGAKLLVKGKPLKGFSKFVDEFANKPFTTDLMYGQYKINSTLRRLVDAGYGMRIDVQGKIDAHLDSPETRGRIERATDIKQRSAARRALSNWYNNAAFFLSEVPGMITPRFFDAVGNNISFRFANTAVSNIEMRLKDLHRKYGSSLWDRYNDPDVLARDSEKMDTLTPTDAFGDQFLFGPDESSLGKLERLFTNGGVDFHAEALRFYKQLDQDKEATFLSPEQRAEIGIGMVTSENLATIANRPLKFRNDPNVGFLFALSGWSLSAAHNSIEYLGKAQGGKKGWGINSLNLNMAMVLLGMAAISGVSFAGQEELFRLIYKYLFGEVKTGRHPWEADSGSEAARRALLYSLSAFPIVNSPFNLMLNDQKGVAAFGMDFFIQSKVKNVLNAAGQIANTRNAEGAERAVLILSKQIYPNSRVLVNRFPAIAGTIGLINNTRLIRRYAPKDMVKESNYTGGSTTASPLTPVVSKMASLAVQGRYDEMRELYRKAIKMAADMKKPDPVRYIQSMYFGKDPYRSGLKGRVNDAFKLRITNKMSDEERREFFRVENNFYRGYAMIGGKRRTSTPSFRIPTSSSNRTRARVRPVIRPLPENYLPRSARPSPLRRAYGV